MYVYGELVSAQLENRDSAPSNPILGLMYHNTVDKKAYVYNGTDWESMSPVPASIPDEIKGIVVGTAAQVSAGVADYSSLQTAIDNAVDGDYLRVLSSTFTEDITIAKNIKIQGNSNLSKVVGTVQFSTGADGCHITNMNIDGDVTVDSGVGSLIITDSWITSTSTVTDNSGLDTNIYLLVSY